MATDETLPMHVRYVQALQQIRHDIRVGAGITTEETEFWIRTMALIPECRAALIQALRENL